MVMTTLLISRAISELVLRPLQRMLISVKEVAKPILGDVSNLSHASPNDMHGEPADDQEDTSRSVYKRVRAKLFGEPSLTSNAGYYTDDDEEDFDDEIQVLETIVQKLRKIAVIGGNMRHDHVAVAGLEPESLGVLALLSSHNPKGEEAASGTDVPKANHDEIDPMPDEEWKSRLEKAKLSFAEIDSWDFNCMSVDRNKQTMMTSWILLQNTAVFGEVTLTPEVVLKFLQTLAQHYVAENPFHNWTHAVDVCHTVWRMMLKSMVHSFLTGVDQFALLASTISHDVGHIGVNNQFLIETGDNLAVRYNDRSPLENMHCAMTFSITSGTPGANIFQTLKKPAALESRKIMIEAILHTDMIHHFEQVKEMQVLYQMNSDTLERESAKVFREKDTKQKVLNLLLHAADVSNPAKPWAICHAWALKCLEEFFNQGDKEKKEGIPVQILNDRTKVNKPSSQIGFIEFMIAPLFAATVKLFPALHDMTETLKGNLLEWNSIWVEETSPSDEEKEKVQARVQKTIDILTEAAPKWRMSGRFSNISVRGLLSSEEDEASGQPNRVSVVAMSSSQSHSTPSPGGTRRNSGRSSSTGD
jgi:cAMP-specific phosphodiesterase 4